MANKNVGATANKLTPKRKKGDLVPKIGEENSCENRRHRAVIFVYNICFVSMYDTVSLLE